MLDSLLTWEICGDTVVQKSFDWGTATLSHGLESEGISSSEKCEHNVENSALSVMGQDQSGEKISLFVEDCELARVATSCHIALDTSCQEVHEARLLACCPEATCHSKKKLSHRGRAVTKRRGMW